MVETTFDSTDTTSPTISKTFSSSSSYFCSDGTNQNNITDLNASNESSEEEEFGEKIASDLLWKIFPPIIFTVGLTGNILTLFVVRRMGLRNQPTLVFITFLAITDSVVLCTGLPNYWIQYTFDYTVKNASNANCKLYLFFIYTSMHYSSWILVGVTVERFIKIYFPFRYRRVFDNKKATIYLAIILAVLCGVNGHLLFTNGINEYSEGECGSLNEKNFWFDEQVFVYIDFIFLSAIPFLIMLTCNIFIAKVLGKLKTERRTMVHRRSLKKANRVSIKMTKMLLVCTSFFLVATAPISVYFILDSYLSPIYEEKGDAESEARMTLAWTIIYILQFSNYSVNFYLYTAVNDRFLQELKGILTCKPSVQKMRVYTLQKNGTGSRRVLQEPDFESQGVEKSISDETPS